MRYRRGIVPLVVLLCVCAIAPAAEAPKKMTFNEVKEVAPGVFFRYSAISPTNSVVFGGCNNIWIVFTDYVVVIDANFPKEAGDVLAAVAKTTPKPVRYVLDTHHHGDHAWGNAVWVGAGASIVSQTHCADLLRLTGPADFAAAGKGPTARKDVAASTLKTPTLTFDDKLVLDDGKQRVEFLYLGHAHTLGDAVAYLPKAKILCTGDACVNGAFNFMGHSDSASWVRCLEKMQQLDVKTVLPGHGPPAGPELLEKQKRYFVELRRAVKKGIDAGKEVEDIIKSIDLPWYKEWTTVKPAVDNIKHVYNEYMGLVAPWDFTQDFGLHEGPSPTKETPGWTKPKKIVVPAGLAPERLAELKRVAPEVEFLPARSPEGAVGLAVDADAVLGYATPEIVKSGKKLRWLQAQPGGGTEELIEALAGRKITLTDLRGLNGPSVAQRTFFLLLALMRKVSEKEKGVHPRHFTELRGKTMVLLGLGGSGMEIARRAHAFGMRVRALDDSKRDRPDFVFSLEKLDKLGERLREADVLVLAMPLTKKTRGIISLNELVIMRKGYLVNAAATGLIDLNAIKSACLRAHANALNHNRMLWEEVRIALDTAYLGELPKDDLLRRLPGGVLTTYEEPPSPEAQEREWRLIRENVRRFASGEPLLGVVEPTSKTKAD